MKKIWKKSSNRKVLEDDDAEEGHAIGGGEGVLDERAEQVNNVVLHGHRSPRTGRFRSCDTSKIVSQWSGERTVTKWRHNDDVLIYLRTGVHTLF